MTTGESAQDSREVVAETRPIEARRSSSESLTLLHPAVKVLLDGIAAKIQSFLAYVDHHNREARQGRALRYSRSHGSRSHHGNVDHPDLLTAQPPSARHN